MEHCHKTRLTPQQKLGIINFKLEGQKGPTLSLQATVDADHDQATNGFGSKILKVFKLSGYLQ